MTNRLLVIDDELEIATFIRDVAVQCGFEVRVTTEAAAFRREYLAFKPDLIVLDLSIPGMDGVELLRFLADHACTAKLLIISGFDRKVRTAAQNLGDARGLRMVGNIPKPIRAAELRMLLAGFRPAA